jgi:hypothetical protein
MRWARYLSATTCVNCFAFGTGASLIIRMAASAVFSCVASPGCKLWAHATSLSCPRRGTPKSLFVECHVSCYVHSSDTAATADLVMVNNSRSRRLLRANSTMRWSIAVRRACMSRPLLPGPSLSDPPRPPLLSLPLPHPLPLPLPRSPPLALPAGLPLRLPWPPCLWPTNGPR